MSEPLFRIRLAKEDFKFSAAHFTLFPDGRAELLHGHNYRVRLELAGPTLSELGLLFDVTVVKKVIRARCAALDEHTLIPSRADRLTIDESDVSVTVSCGNRVYRFPRKDVVLLPLVNVSMELLARMLWWQVASAVEDVPLERMSIEVEETQGQSCTYIASLPSKGLRRK